MKLVFCYGLLTILILGNVFAQDVAHEEQLWTALFTDYTKHLRSITDTTNVSLSFTLQSLHNLDIFKGTIAMSLWVKMVWNDPRLTWDPSSYGDISLIRVPKTDVWLPDVTLYNSAEPLQEMAEVHVVLYFDGTIYAIPPVQATASCPLDLSDYPYDTHTCSLKWGSWTHDNRHIALQAASETIDLNDYHSNHIWELVSTNLIHNTIKYPCCVDVYEDVSAIVTIRRRETHGRIASAVITTWLLLIVFLISPSSGGERIVFAGFIFVSLVVLTSSLSVVVPAYSTTRLGRFLLAGMLITAIVTAINALFYRFYPGDQCEGSKVMVPASTRVFIIVDAVALVVTSALLAIITGALFA